MVESANVGSPKGVHHFPLPAHCRKALRRALKTAIEIGYIVDVEDQQREFVLNRPRSAVPSRDQDGKDRDPRSSNARRWPSPVPDWATRSRWHQSWAGQMPMGMSRPVCVGKGWIRSADRTHSNAVGARQVLAQQTGSVSKMVPQMECPTFDAFLILDRHLSALVNVRNRTKRAETLCGSSNRVHLWRSHKRDKFRRPRQCRSSDHESPPGFEAPAINDAITRRRMWRKQEQVVAKRRFVLGLLDGDGG
jgi:hypothetical protein